MCMSLFAITLIAIISLNVVNSFVFHKLLPASASNRWRSFKPEQTPGTVFQGRVADLAVQGSATYTYLKDNLQLSEKSINRIVNFYSSLLYLRVDNIEQKVSILHQYGFADAHIRDIFEQVPTILALQSKSIEEKLAAIKESFHLNDEETVRIVTKVPFLLSSSASRNEEVRECLMGDIGFSETQLRKLMTSYPRIGALKSSQIAGIWNELLTTYQLSQDVSRSILIKLPRLLARQTMPNTTQYRLSILEKTMGIIPGSSEFEKACKQNPSLLLLDPDRSILRNANFLTAFLKLSNKEAKQVLRRFPQILGHNPINLEVRCAELWFMLTGCVWTVDGGGVDGGGVDGGGVDGLGVDGGGVDGGGVDGGGVDGGGGILDEPLDMSMSLTDDDIDTMQMTQNNVYGTDDDHSATIVDASSVSDSVGTVPEGEVTNMYVDDVSEDNDIIDKCIDNNINATAEDNRKTMALSMQSVHKLDQMMMMMHAVVDTDSPDVLLLSTEAQKWSSTINMDPMSARKLLASIPSLISCKLEKSVR